MSISPVGSGQYLSSDGSDEQSSISKLEKQKEDLQKELQDLEKSDSSNNADKIKLLRQEIVNINAKIQQLKNSSKGQSAGQSQSVSANEALESDTENSGNLNMLV